MGGSQHCCLVRASSTRTLIVCLPIFRLCQVPIPSPLRYMYGVMIFRTHSFSWNILWLAPLVVGLLERAFSLSGYYGYSLQYVFTSWFFILPEQSLTLSVGNISQVIDFLSYFQNINM